MHGAGSRTSRSRSRSSPSLPGLHDLRLAWKTAARSRISIGWPVHLRSSCSWSAFSMAELTSRYPTAGGPYWWAARLGGPGWSWMTGWFNIVGLVGIVASVGYGAAIVPQHHARPLRAQHLRHQFRRRRTLPRRARSCSSCSFSLLYTLLNIFGDRLLAHAQQHLGGLACARCCRDHRPARSSCPATTRASTSSSARRLNNSSALATDRPRALAFWFLVLPLGFLLTMYTQTGYDASAHTAEETRGASIAAAQGVWRSVFLSAADRMVRAARTSCSRRTTLRLSTMRAAPSSAIFTTALAGDPWAAKLIDPDRDRRSAVLRSSRPDQRLAHLVRVLA